MPLWALVKIEFMAKIEITLDEMINKMVASDLEKAKQHALLEKHGYLVTVGKET